MEELKTILLKIDKVISNEMIYLTGVGMDFYELNGLIDEIWSEDRIWYINYIDSIIAFYDKKIKNKEEFIQYSQIWVDKFKNTQYV